jgi:DNA adenine methylase
VAGEFNARTTPMPVASPPPADPGDLPGRPRPFLKWAGSKKQLLAAYHGFYPPPDKVGTYHEPFLGSGAVFFHLRRLLPDVPAQLSDNNAELITTFRTVQQQATEVITVLGRHARKHCEAHFYEVRDQRPADLDSDVERAARFIYLNKTCFNGLYRVNSKGQFNVPMGRYAQPSIVDPEALVRASQALRGARLDSGHFAQVLERARPGDFVYFDPPYVPVSGTAYFTAYTKGDFGPEDQGHLAWVFRELAERGCRVMLSNSDTPLVRELYCRYTILDVLARRSINSKSDRRGPVREVVVLNYDPDTGALRLRSSASSSDRAKVAKSGNRATRASR